MKLFPKEKLYEEMAFIGYYMHWPMETVMNMEHWQRAKWCGEISAINVKINGEDEKKNVFDI